ncbi:probable cytochrome P450 6g2 [Bradysia coprophila]|uniref:probable cytochrome P450 6g2 n=1 Tax=Bradysia coprophila TaxID=38358 RepID=UPI00187DD34E|nr:probable cytochrome P450 6g2 [Bradysia coprophila]
MFGLTEILICFILTILTGLYCSSLYINSYWKRNKIPFISAKPIAGNLLDLLLFRKSVAEIFSDIYNDQATSHKPIVGIHFFHKPALVIKDPELIKKVLVKDFNSFNDRHSASDIHTDILGSTNLFFIRNPAWKILRGRLSPFFTSGKMKQMFHLMKNIGNEMNDTLLSFKLDENKQTFSTDIKDILARYTTDVIASCAYGVEANSLKNPESEFRKNGKRIFDFNWYRAVEFSSIFFVPELVPFFKFKAFSKQSTTFLRNTINYIIGERERTGSVRNDLIDTLITLKNEDKSKNLTATNIVFQDDVIVAQAAVFFTAGYETSSTIMSFGLYELAFQLDIQRKLRQEIKETLLASKGELTYDIVQNMVYLNMVVQEMLRMYPPLPFLDRLCTNPEGYSLEPHDNFVIPHKMPIVIPVFAIQRDPKYWPNPNKFDPERFSAANKDKIVPYTLLPLGTGPHNCIGERFGILQTKIGLINFMKNHHVTPTENTPRVLQFEPKALIIQSKGGMVLNVVRDPLF